MKNKILKIRFNPKLTEEQIMEFKENINKNGGYCPCMIGKSEDTKCMCKNFRSQKTEGVCHCGLYDKYFE